MSERKLLVHLDVDSPIKLLEFYKARNVRFDQGQLDSFYRVAWDRALEFFNNEKIKATFFVVGDELESSDVVRATVAGAHRAGHEIENHTYSHPFGFAALTNEEVRSEILACNEAIQKATGMTPVGFRSPGYSMNSATINLLETLGFKYDSSGFWSVLPPLLKIFQKVLFKKGVNNADFGGITRDLPHAPYSPDPANWLKRSTGSRTIVELPLPRMLGLPFYNNFNLWAPPAYSAFLSNHVTRPALVYLFHIVEFMDMTDGIPEELQVHPNLKTPVPVKLKRSRSVLSNLVRRFEPISTRDFLARHGF